MGFSPPFHPDDRTCARTRPGPQMSNPIEVWLRQDDGCVVLMIVNADESVYARDVTWRSLAAAQREITGFLVAGLLRTAVW
jgi:hypothetical protein